jgi:hypothetical protein
MSISSSMSQATATGKSRPTWSRCPMSREHGQPRHHRGDLQARRQRDRPDESVRQQSPGWKLRRHFKGRPRVRKAGGAGAIGRAPCLTLTGPDRQRRTSSPGKGSEASSHTQATVARPQPICSQPLANRPLRARGERYTPGQNRTDYPEIFERPFRQLWSHSTRGAPGVAGS